MTLATAISMKLNIVPFFQLCLNVYQGDKKGMRGVGGEYEVQREEEKLIKVEKCYYK